VPPATENVCAVRIGYRQGRRGSRKLTENLQKACWSSRISLPTLLRNIMRGTLPMTSGAFRSHVSAVSGANIRR
jgi:hypothetical protein